MESILGELQALAITCAGAAVTAFIAWVFTRLREYFDIAQSDSNEGEIRRAALTEAGKLIQTGGIADQDRVIQSVSKVIADLHGPITEEGYDSADIKDMILGAAATIFPPAGLLKLLK
jgi:hypothetical protein